MGEGLQKVEEGAKRSWPVIMSWVGGITALIGLFASLGGGVTWVLTHRRDANERKAKMAVAQAQTDQADYQMAIETYGEILKNSPLDQDVLTAQLNTAMLWTENYHVSGKDGQDLSALARPGLDEIMSVLEAGMTRSTGTRRADVQAHIGWWHWLNQKMAEREFGPAAELNLRAALTLDPQNVYANAMLGNYMIMNHENFDEAMHHLDVAVSTGKVRPLVREYQLGGLIYLDEKGARAAQVKIANDIRKAGEPLDEYYKSRILSWCFDLDDGADSPELKETLSAVPPKEEWQTYLWLDNESRKPDSPALAHDFIQAKLTEMSGDKEGALAMYRSLQQEMKNSGWVMKDYVDSAVTRLSHA